MGKGSKGQEPGVRASVHNEQSIFILEWRHRLKDLIISQ